MPGLIWRCPTEMLVRPDLVVPETEISQQSLQRLLPIQLDTIQLALQRPEHTLNSPIHPRAAGNRELLLDACQRAAQPEYTAFEHRIVIGADDLGFAIPANGDKQPSQQGPGILVLHCFEHKQPAAAVIHDAQYRMNFPVHIPFAAHIHPPDTIEGIGRGG